MLFTFKKHLKNSSFILWVIFGFVFIFCLSNPAIYSPDTYSYLSAMPYRQMGYVLFLKSFSFVFGSYFDVAVVFVHTVFSLFSVYYFFKKIAVIFDLNKAYKFIILAILLFPFFPPLSMANNLCSEGLGYGLYLLFVAIGVDLLFNDNRIYLKYYLLVYLALITIRGQFFFSTLVFAGVYFLIHRETIFKRQHTFSLIALFGIMAISSLTERSYHKLKDGFFKPTPLGFVSASTAPIYVSDVTDYSLIENNDYREILKISYDTLVKKELLLKPNRTAKEDYLFFHENLPKICNQTVLQQAVNYYSDDNIPNGLTKQQVLSYRYFESEAACKVFTIALIKDNFEQWIKLFYTNITFGFYSPVIFLLVVLIFVFSLIKTIVTSKKQYAILFLLSSLILSNALFIAFASHSIMRYLFYNYALLFLLFISTLKLLKRE
jgi:O-antigen ligase